MVECPEGCGDYDNLAVHWGMKHEGNLPEDVQPTSDELHDKLSTTLSGDGNSMYGKTAEEHPAWKGDDASARRIHQRNRNIIRQRDDNECQICDATAEDQDGRSLSVHHINEPVESHEDLVTVCQSCHMKLHHGTIELESFDTIV